MSSEDQLKEKLRKIEALFAGATFIGEKGAASAAAERIRAQLKEVEAREPPIEVRFSLPDPWSVGVPVRGVRDEGGALHGGRP